MSSLGDYKDNVLSLLVTLVDSNLIRASDYDDYFTKIRSEELKEKNAEEIKEKTTSSSKGLSRAQKEAEQISHKKIAISMLA